LLLVTVNLSFSSDSPVCVKENHWNISNILFVKEGLELQLNDLKVV